MTRTRTVALVLIGVTLGLVWISMLLHCEVAAEEQAGRQDNSRQTALIGFAVKMPLVLYVQRTRGENEGYAAFVTELLRALRDESGKRDIIVALWPDLPEKDTPVLREEDLKAEAKFEAVLTSARAMPDSTQFQAGLRVCSDLATKNKAQIVVLADGQSVGPFDMDKDSVAAQVKAIEAVSQIHRVSVICFGASAEEYRKHISGFAASITLGQIPSNARIEKAKAGT